MRGHMWRTAIAAAAVLGASVGLSTAAHAEDDPALQQVVSEDEVVAPAGEPAVVTDGHIDLGPLMIDGKLDFLARDDRAEHPVWRHLEDMTFVVSDAGKQSLPEGGEYDFTGAKAGEDVWVVPQTQIQQVPWLGWSTQSPAVTREVDRGINLEYGGHQGDGQFTLFLQAGNFGKAQQLWSSASAEPQAVWVDLKTHTHANWVFTKPGVHLVKVHLKAKLVNGTEVDIPKVLRFAVGGADVAQAQAAQWDSANDVQGATDSSTANQPSENTTSQATGGAQRGGLSTVTIITIGLFGLAALAILVALLMFMRAQKAQRQAAEATQSSSAASATGRADSQPGQANEDGHE